jgi:NADH dehydrogenase (ubiquinone) 1 alpha subcomplex subunit 2
MKKHNPHTPIMMREATGTEPRVFARYGTTKAQSKESDKANTTDHTELGKEKQEALSGSYPRFIRSRLTNR